MQTQKVDRLVRPASLEASMRSFSLLSVWPCSWQERL